MRLTPNEVLGVVAMVLILVAYVGLMEARR